MDYLFSVVSFRWQGSNLLFSSFYHFRSGPGIPRRVTIDNKSGEIELKNGADLKLVPILGSEIGTISGGKVTGDGTINGNAINDELYKLGKSPGIITITGDYLQTATGLLEVEIGGAAPGTGHDQLIVGGTATFEEGARIDVRFLPGTNISAGANLNFVDAEAFSGELMDIVFNIMGLPDVAAIELNLGVNGLSLTALEDVSTVPLPGSLLLLFSAMIGIMGLRHKRRMPFRQGSYRPTVAGRTSTRQRNRWLHHRRGQWPLWHALGKPAQHANGR